ncbi:hypothetical protein V7056_08600, partial [Bacillus sp. JJ664]
MKIKCLMNKGSSGLTLDKYYLVFGGEYLLGDSKEYIIFKIQNDYGSVIPYRADLFQVVTNNEMNYIHKNVDGKIYAFDHQNIA